ncbi:hypothetical protein Tco_0550396 [Tanacetum coccineum]
MTLFESFSMIMTVGAHYSETTSALSAHIAEPGNQIAYISQNIQHKPRPGHPNTVEFTYSDESDEDEPLEVDKSKIDPLIRESLDAFLMGDEEIKLYSHENHFHEVLKVQKLIHSLSGSPTPYSNPIVMSFSPFLTPFGDSDLLLEETNTFLAFDDSILPDIDNGKYDSEGDILFLEKLLEDEPSEAKKSEINHIIREPSDTFLMGDTEIKFNPLKDIDDPVTIPRIFEKPLDSLNYNPIFDIQNKENDESETETIMDEETDIQEKDKNKAKKDKTEHENEKSMKK